MRISLTLLALAACASSPIPVDHVPTAQEVGSRATGSWIAVWDRRERLVVGELIAIDRGSFYLLPERRQLVTIPVAEVDHARLEAYRSDSSGLAIWGGLGTASTLSHGGWLLISAPAWILTSIAAGSINRHHPFYDYPDHPAEELRAFARFPQGVPPGVDLELLLGAGR